MHIVTVAILFLAFFAAWPVSAQAEHPPGPNCVKDVGKLGTVYHEVPGLIGVEKNGDLMMLYFSDDSGTWTIVSFNPDNGWYCFRASGDGLQLLGLLGVKS